MPSCKPIPTSFPATRPEYAYFSGRLNEPYQYRIIIFVVGAEEKSALRFVGTKKLPDVDIPPVAFVVFPVVICAAKVKLPTGQRPCDVLYQRNGVSPVAFIDGLSAPVITASDEPIFRYKKFGILYERIRYHRRCLTLSTNAIII